jgi:hypothetical protein
MPGGAEASGIYFGAEPGTLFVNVTAVPLTGIKKA